MKERDPKLEGILSDPKTLIPLANYIDATRDWQGLHNPHGSVSWVEHGYGWGQDFQPMSDPNP